MQEPNRSRRVCIRRGKKNSICGQTHRQTQRLAPLWQFKSLIWGISSGFPLASHFDLPGSAYIFGISQSLSMHAHTFLSQDGFHSRGLQVMSISSHHSPFDLQGGFLCLRSQRGSPDLENKKCLVSYLLSGQGPASSLSCPPIDILEFQSTGYESPFYPGGANTYREFVMWQALFQEHLGSFYR